MIGKAIRGASFSETLEYVMGKNKADILFTQNLGSPESAERVAICMEATSGVSRCKKPVYHLIVSWDPDDNVSKEQMAEVAQRLLNTLGLAEHQAVATQHRDTEHPHLHVVANRVHPRHGEMMEDGARKQVWRGWGDMATIEQALRGMEKEFGWREVPGRLSIQPGHEIPPKNPVSKGGYHDRKEEGLPPIKSGLEAKSTTLRRHVGGDMPDDLPRTATDFYGVWAAALRGDAECQWKMGRVFELGAGVRRNSGVSAGWYRAAANQGHAEAIRAYERCTAAGLSPRPLPPLRGFREGDQDIPPSPVRRRCGKEDIGEWIGEWLGDPSGR